jgi:predicted dehydrogenase
MKDTSKVTRREAVAMAGAATAAAVVANKFKEGPFIQKVKAANNQVQYAIIGTGGRGQYHIKHFNKLDSGRCVALCDINDVNLQAAIKASKDKPVGFKDYRELLSRKDIDAVVISTPLFMHYPVTRDALLAGKHVFCEKSMVFKPEEVHGLRKLAEEHPKQVLQCGLQRRYSKFYQTAKQMVEKGTIGRVTHAYAQWHRNPGWTMKPDKDLKVQKERNWRLYRETSGGLVAELASHQIDVCDWMFNANPEFVVGVGDLTWLKDGRDVYDNVQLIFKYPKNQKLMYSTISTNKHLTLFNGQRNEFGEVIMGTEGTIEITVGTDDEPAVGLWFYEPGPKLSAADLKKQVAAVAGATMASTGRGSRALPILFEKDTLSGKESFIEKEMKFARRWLYAKGVMVPEEDRNPCTVQLDHFLECCRTGKKPLADLEIGLADSSMVILSNLALDEGRRVYFNEMDKMGRKA